MSVPPELSRAQSFIFDFDGTLAPNLDLPDMRRQVIGLTRAHQVPGHAFENLFIVEIIEAATRWLAQHRPDTAGSYHHRAHRLITEFELAAAADTRPFPGARKTLDDLRRRGKRLGVVTRNCSLAVRTVFHDIDAYCTTVLARDNAEFLKPDPRHVTQALTALDAAPEQSVMVGDGQMDMQVGKALGMICIGVLSGSGTRDRLQAAGADLVVENVRELTCHVT